MTKAPPAIRQVVAAVKEWSETGGNEVGGQTRRPGAPVGEGRDTGEDVPRGGEEADRADRKEVGST